MKPILDKELNDIAVKVIDSFFALELKLETVFEIHPRRHIQCVIGWNAQEDKNCYY